ncbi:MAG: hypothetical protein PHY92_07940 [Alphaproteobacteria bacterium]|nr:hypothetical protein [Alphaproteobacteria bacterium]
MKKKNYLWTALGFAAAMSAVCAVGYYELRQHIGPKANIRIGNVLERIDPWGGRTSRSGHASFAYKVQMVDGLPKAVFDRFYVPRYDAFIEKSLPEQFFLSLDEVEQDLARIEKSGVLNNWPHGERERRALEDKSSLMVAKKMLEPFDNIERPKFKHINIDKGEPVAVFRGPVLSPGCGNIVGHRDFNMSMRQIEKELMKIEKNGILKGWPEGKVKQYIADYDRNLRAAMKALEEFEAKRPWPKQTNAVDAATSKL